MISGQRQDRATGKDRCMGVIINPRGTSGSGKTELVRRLLSDYGWKRGGDVEPIHRKGRERPIAYLLQHPLGG
jgi:hypothetical protein